jgi:cation transport regulator ChaB
MPYRGNEDLPDQVRKNLPDSAQTVWRRAFEAARKKGWPEERCFKYAWGAVKNWTRKE